MKKIFLLTFLSFITIALNAQIKLIDTKKEEPKEEKNLVYDSLSSLSYENARLHVGQTLFFKGYKIFLRDGVYSPPFLKKKYETVKIKGKGKELSSYLVFKTDHPDSMSYKYYDVIGVTAQERSEYHKGWEKSLTEEEAIKAKILEYTLELVEKESKDTVYYKIDWSDLDTKVFITVGYYEKIKELFLGQDFYTKSYKIPTFSDKPEEVEKPLFTKMKCVDAVVNKEGYFFLVMEDGDGQKFKCRFTDFYKDECDNKIGFKNFVSAKKYDFCIEKFGKEFGEYAARGITKRGMTKEMVLEIKGKPKKINYTTGEGYTEEQWIYGEDTYFYFSNGKLTGKQY